MNEILILIIVVGMILALMYNFLVGKKNQVDNIFALMVAVENYPELKANENLIHLQKTLNEIT